MSAPREAPQFIRRYGILIGFLIFGVMGLAGLKVATDASNDAGRSADAAQRSADAAQATADQNSQVLDRILAERKERTRAVSGVIFLGCSRDNKQDLLLGALLAGSLRQGANRPNLTRGQRSLLHQYQVKLRELQKVPICSDVVKAFLRQSGVDPKLGAAPLRPPPIKQKDPAKGSP